MGQPEIGAILAGHRLEAIAGRGGMGVVFRAVNLRLKRTVALKVIAAELASDEDFRRRFIRESELAAQIEHPHVIPLYEAGEDDGQLYIAMRYVEGTDLHALIARRGRLEPRLAARIVAQTASALDAAHARGLVHRDVKPGNVLIATQDGEAHAYLTDFGLTKAVSSISGVTKTGMLVGTVDYIAPEQIQGRRVDARADVYALGCVLFQALTGQVPYPRDSDVAKIWAHAHDPAPSVLIAAPEIPRQFDDIVRRAMAKDPDSRYPSAGDLGRAALAAADGESVSRAERSVATGAAAPDTAAPAAAVASTVPAGMHPDERTRVAEAKLADGQGETVRSGGVATRRAAPGGVQGAPQGPSTPGRSRFPARTAAFAAALVIGIAVVILLVSGAFTTSKSPKTQARAATPTTPPAPTVKSFADAKLGVGFSYPASWHALTLQGAAADFGDGTSRCALIIERGVVPAGSSQQAQFAFVRSRSASAASASKQYDLRAIQAEHGANLAGVGLVRVADGQGGHLGFFFRGRDAYIFDCVTPAANFDRVDQQAFRPLLATVRIG